ncbi:MAG: hypothetical protein K9M07_05020 [Simkaniaceae bacterium]|nr:hypothetical protein [Simkaniaceae bacterium]
MANAFIRPVTHSEAQSAGFPEELGKSEKQERTTEVAMTAFACACSSPTNSATHFRAVRSPVEDATPAIEDLEESLSPKSCLKREGTPPNSSPVTFNDMTYWDDGIESPLTVGRRAIPLYSKDEELPPDISARILDQTLAKRDDERLFPIYDSEGNSIPLSARKFLDYALNFEETIQCIERETDPSIAWGLWMRVYSIMDRMEAIDPSAFTEHMKSTEVIASWSRLIDVFDSKFPHSTLTQDMRHHLLKRTQSEDEATGAALKLTGWIDPNMRAFVRKIKRPRMRYWGNLEETARSALDSIHSLVIASQTQQENLQIKWDKIYKANGEVSIPINSRIFIVMGFWDEYSRAAPERKDECYKLFSFHVKVIRPAVRACFLVTQGLLLPRDESLSIEEHREISRTLFDLLPVTFRNIIQRYIGMLNDERAGLDVDLSVRLGDTLMKEDIQSPTVLQGIREIRKIFLTLFYPFV